MNHETTIKRIQELTDGMKLEFGCEVVLYSEEYSKNSRILKVLDKRHISGIDTIVEVCENNSNGVSHISYVAKNELKILGKPITLSVVLLAIGKINKGGVYLRSDGVFFSWKGFAEGGDGNHKVESTFIEWNLSKDNFNDQSEETKAFIGGLLTNK